MKTSTLCSLILAGMFLLPCSAVSAPYGDIYVSLIEGDVLMNTEDTQDWVPAAGNTPLGESDRVWVGDGGRSELRLRRGAVIRLNSHTALEVGAEEEKGFRFFVDAGEVYIRVEEPSSDAMVIETPAVTIRPDRRSSLRIDVSEAGAVSLSVLNGVVMVDRPYGDLEVAPGQRLVFRPDWPRPQLAALRSPDAFDRWNRSRDHEQFGIRRSVSRQYLPEELIGYAADFDHNGRWVETPAYGFVWTPTVAIAGDWSPYRSGRWVWMRGDYVWISYDNWGWAPHHYGRWAFVRPFGWCWIPPAGKQAYWGPGYVGWVHTAAAISWVPLAPRELYYGHGFHGPQSVDVGRLPKQWSTSQNINPYRNVRVANAVRTVHRDTFLTGRPIAFKAQPNPFLERRTAYAPPSIKPERTTMMPQIREVRSSERPPERLFTGKKKRNEKAPSTSSTTASPGVSKTPLKVGPPSMPGSLKGRDNHLPKEEGKIPHSMVPLPTAPPTPAAPPQPVVTVPRVAVPSVRGEQPAREGMETAVHPAAANARAKKPMNDALKRPIPPQAPQPVSGIKNPTSSSGGKVDVAISNGKVVVEKDSPPNQPPRIAPKTPSGTKPKAFSPAPKPPNGMSVPITGKTPSAPLKPPAPDASLKSDTKVEKRGREATEGKDHRLNILKGEVPEKDGEIGKEPREGREVR